MRLKAVVCEFAMLPEMFSSANDCALESRHRGGECAEDTHTVLQSDPARMPRSAATGRKFG